MQSKKTLIILLSGAVLFYQLQGSSYLPGPSWPPWQILGNVKQKSYDFMKASLKSPLFWTTMVVGGITMYAAWNIVKNRANRNLHQYLPEQGRGMLRPGEVEDIRYKTAQEFIKQTLGAIPYSAASYVDSRVSSILEEYKDYFQQEHFQYSERQALYADRALKEFFTDSGSAFKRYFIVRILEDDLQSVRKTEHMARTAPLPKDLERIYRQLRLIYTLLHLSNMLSDNDRGQLRKVLEIPEGCPSADYLLQYLKPDRGENLFCDRSQWNALSQSGKKIVEEMCRYYQQRNNQRVLIGDSQKRTATVKNMIRIKEFFRRHADISSSLHPAWLNDSEVIDLLFSDTWLENLDELYLAPMRYLRAMGIFDQLARGDNNDQRVFSKILAMMDQGMDNDAILKAINEVLEDED